MNKILETWLNVKQFWLRSYTTDRRAFWAETVSSACVFMSMTAIAVTAQHPPMHLIYPISFIGAIVSIYAWQRRGAAWPLVMSSYFAVLHVFGWFRAMNLI